ncbi:MAG TPA: rhamnulokinase family protein [Candidatus Sulfomarinibacteraceae bacterium]|nr:rhamnulokinase family protein [Candidatus Sulfomarinibacteraceae bacterium]
MAQQTVLAVDLGAESGRVMAVHFDGSSLSLQELHRFANTPVNVRGALYWNVLGLWRDVQAGLQKGQSLQPAALGVDTWGVDFGLLDEQGELLGNPVHYRDARTEGMMETAFERVPRDEIFRRTGIQFMPINTLYQLLSLARRRSPQLEVAATFLTMPDLLNYWLTGARVCEYTIASTTQMLDARSGEWATDIMERLDIPAHIFPDIAPPGTRLGQYDGVPVIAPACHDTGSAVAAVPIATAAGREAAYISSGTWSLVGLEVDQPALGQAALAANVTNEGGVAGTYRLLKNVTGLWILQQCRQTWAAAGHEYDYEQLVALAQEAPPLRSLLQVDDEAFLPPGDHPQIVRDACRRTSQPAPQTHGEVVRAVLESLALAYRRVLEQLETVSGRTVEVIHIVGGGSQNELLNQMTADATGRSVLAGPVEATVLGNALVQLITLGELRDIHEARQLVANSGHLRRYEPQNTGAWDEAYGRYQELAAR